jgi:Rho-binding antiterminator
LHTCIYLSIQPRRDENGLRLRNQFSMEKKTYVPISCSYYDELEALATFKKLVNIQYLDEQGAAQETEDVIKDLFTKEKVEYMLLQSGNSIRLDHLIKVDGKALPHHC